MQQHDYYHILILQTCKYVLSCKSASVIVFNETICVPKNQSRIHMQNWNHNNRKQMQWLITQLQVVHKYCVWQLYKSMEICVNNKWSKPNTKSIA